MIEVDSLKIDGKPAIGVKIELPDSPPLVAVIAKKGFIMCGYLNIEAAEKLKVTAAMVSGVKTFDEVLEAEVKRVTSKAEKKGVKSGMKGREAVKLLC